jgi:hypothetical protein
MKKMYNININFDTKTWKKSNGYISYGFYICECTLNLFFCIIVYSCDFSFYSYKLIVFHP